MKNVKAGLGVVCDLSSGAENSNEDMEKKQRKESFNQQMDFALIAKEQEQKFIQSHYDPFGSKKNPKLHQTMKEKDSMNKVKAESRIGSVYSAIHSHKS